MKKLLVVVDYQNDFVDGALGFPKAKLIEEGICDRIIEYENNGDDVIFTLDTHYEDYMETEEGKNLPVKHCIKGTSGYELYGNVKDLAISHLKFEKLTFPSNQLLKYLEENPYDVVELCGVVTNICVISNAVIAKAALPNAHIVVNVGLSASNDEEMEFLSIQVMKNLHIETI